MKVSWLELTSLPLAQDADDTAVEPATVFHYLQNHAPPGDRMPGLAKPIRSEQRRWLPAERGWMRVEWRVRCDASPTSALQRAFFGL